MRTRPATLPSGTYRATCVPGHAWTTTARLERRARAGTPGRRAGAEFVWLLAVPNCPECGHGWGTLVPVAPSDPGSSSFPS